MVTTVSGAIIMPSVLDLPVLWFVIIGVLLAAYALLDGFDLGVGMLAYAVARETRERTTAIRSTPPVWDGTEVWLLVAAGAMFAAFPLVYPFVFSGFYVALIVAFLALVARALARVVRDRRPALWDAVLAVSALTAAFLIGDAIGILLEGDALARGAGAIFDRLPVLTGSLAVAMFAMQAGAWLALRTTGALQLRSRRAGAISALVFGLLWLAVTLAAWEFPYLHDLPVAPAGYAIPVLIAVATIAAVAASARQKDGWAFVATSAAIALLGALGGLALFPEVLPSNDPAMALALQDGAASELRLRVLLVLGIVAVPFVLAYLAYVWFRLRGIGPGRS